MNVWLISVSAFPGVRVRSLALAVASAIAPIVLAVVPVLFTVAGALPDPAYAAEVGRIVDITGTLITGLFRIRAERTARFQLTQRLTGTTM